MVKKEFTMYGKSLQELKGLSVEELARLVPARARRTLTRGFTPAQKKFLKVFRAKKNNVKTHCRDMLVLPEMVNAMIMIYNGKSFEPVQIKPEMIGHYLGEFTYNRKKVQHSSPGIGATRSSAAISVK